MARTILTGDKEIENTLTKLADKAADRVARNALGAGLTVVAKAMKQAAPVGKTGAVKASIGKRNEKKKRTGVMEAKAGINVGKKTKQKGRFAPHAHLVALGTKPRQRKRIGGRFSYLKNPTPQQLSTGTMPANSFVRMAYESSRSAARTAMTIAAKRSLGREVAKARKK
jgi:HK97 gp10 family phage protein